MHDRRRRVTAPAMRRAGVGVTLVALGTAGTRLALQQRVVGEAALAGATPPDAARAMTAAVRSR